MVFVFLIGSESEQAAGTLHDMAEERKQLSCHVSGVQTTIEVTYTNVAAKVIRNCTRVVLYCMYGNSVGFRESSTADAE